MREKMVVTRFSMGTWTPDTSPSVYAYHQFFLYPFLHLSVSHCHILCLEITWADNKTSPCLLNKARAFSGRNRLPRLVIPLQYINKAGKLLST